MALRLLCVLGLAHLAAATTKFHLSFQSTCAAEGTSTNTCNANMSSGVAEGKAGAGHASDCNTNNPALLTAALITFMPAATWCIQTGDGTLGEAPSFALIAAAAATTADGATTTASVYTRTAEITLQQDWIAGGALVSGSDALPGGVNVGEKNAITAFSSTVSWGGAGNGADGLSNSAAWSTDTWTGATTSDNATYGKGQMAISKIVTNVADGKTNVDWTHGMRIELSVTSKGNTLDGDTSLANGVFGVVATDKTFCKLFDDAMATAQKSTETRLAIKCVQAVIDGSASPTAGGMTLTYATEFDLKFAAAYFNMMKTDSYKNGFEVTHADFDSIQKVEVYTSTSDGGSDGSAKVEASAATYSATAKATKHNSGSWDENEACVETMKALPKHARHSVWAKCTSTEAGVMTMTFYHKYDIQKTLRGLSQIPTSSVVDKIEPLTYKDGTKDAAGLLNDYTIATYNLKISNPSTAAYTKKSDFSVLTADSPCKALDDALTTDSDIIWCDDKLLAHPVANDFHGKNVYLRFGMQANAVQLRTLMSKVVTVDGTADANSQTVLAVAASSLTSNMYAIKYDLEAVVDATIVAAPETANTPWQKNPFLVGNSGCKWVADVGTEGVSKPVWCESTATTMTLWFADATQAKEGAVLIGALLGAVTTRTTIASATPTSAKMMGGSELLQSIEYVSAFATGQTSINPEPTVDAVTSTSLANSICNVVSDTNTDHIFCDGLKAAGSTVTLKYLTLADLRTAGKALMATQTQETPAPAVAVYVQLLTPKAGQTYTATYTVTLSKDGDVPPAPTPFGVSVGKLTSTNSACAGYTAAKNCIFCASDTAGGMTMHWVTHDDRTTDGVAISGVGAADPTSITDPTSVTPPAKITTLKYTVRSDTDDTAWTASDGKRGQAASACKIANDVITHHKAVYCKSLKESGSEMTLKFFAAADALDNAQSIRQTKSGTPTAKEVRFAVPVADTLYTAAYSLTAAVDTNGDAATVTADAVGADGDGCKFLAKANSAYCMGDESSTTLYFLGAAARRTDLTKLAKVAGSGNIGHVVLDAVKDQAVAGTLVSLSYKTTNDKGEDFKKDAFNTGVAGSACGKGSGLKMFVSCASVVANEGTTVWKWITGADDVTATPDYVSDARKLADMANADKTQVFELLGESASPSVVTSSYSVAILTTTLKPTRRSLAVQDGDVESTGGFTLANSWCKVLSASAPNAIFCTSDTGSATFTHLQDAGTDTATLAATDSRALNAVTTHYVALTPAMKVEITLAVNKNLKADALCSKWNGAGIKNVASCAHETVEIPAPTRRRLTTASVKVTLGFLTQGDLTAAKTAYDVIDWEKKFTEVEGAPGPLVSIGDLTPTPTPTPIAATPGGNVGTPATPTPKKPSSAALRVVGVVVLAGFLAV